MPFRSELAASFITEVKKYMQWQSTDEILKGTIVVLDGLEVYLLTGSQALLRVTSLLQQIFWEV